MRPGSNSVYYRKLVGYINNLAKEVSLQLGIYYVHNGTHTYKNVLNNAQPQARHINK